ncbi:MAG: response regulator transcription factor [Anaerolineae bacterium]|nr:response regulator transcription factor [Anaerolineae bacterium]
MNKSITDGKSIRVVVADDHEEIRNSICSLLAREDNISIVAQATNGREAIKCVEGLRPDVILLDIMMPYMDGFQVINRMKNASTKIIVVSMHMRTSFIRYAVKLGVEGYVLKSSLEEVVDAIQAVSQNRNYFSSAVLQVVKYD